jgi:hypothetical protein
LERLKQVKYNKPHWLRSIRGHWPPGPTEKKKKIHKLKIFCVLDIFEHIKAIEKKYYYLLKSTTVTLAMVTQGKSDHYMFITSIRPIRFNNLQADVQSYLVRTS